jgi:hypothetical protein
VLGLDVQLRAVLLEHVDAPVVAHGVGDPRADDVRQHADGHDHHQREAALGDVEAGEQHRRLGRDRDARRLQQHEAEDSAQPELVDDVDGELDQRVGDRGLRVEHGRARVAADP